MYLLFYALSRLLQLLSLAIFVQVIMSWVYPQGKVYYWLTRLTAPVLSPFRQLSYWIMQRTSLPLDFTPWFAMIGISIASRLLWRIYYLLPRVLR